MSGVPPEIAKMLNAQLGAATNQFLTVDRAWTIVLAPDYLTVQTLKYTTWSELRRRVTEVIAALNETFAPSFFTRVGLQYQNAINREELGLEGVKWSELISDKFFAGWAIPAFEENIDFLSHAVQVRLPDDLGKVTAQNGFGNAQGKTGVSFILDFDFFKEGHIEVGDVTATIDKFNILAGRAFRGCMQERLRTALGPQTIPADDDTGAPASAAFG